MPIEESVGGAVTPPLAVGPSAVEGIPPEFRATASFALVLAFGAGALFRSQRTVEAALDSSMGELHVSFVYGVLAYGLVAFLGLLGVSQLSLVGIADPLVVYAAAAVVGSVMLSLAGLGYIVVGTRLFELLGDRQPWNGLVLGAVLSAVTWLVLPPLAAGLIWMGLAAVGIGGHVRAWMHDERGVVSESET